MAQMTAAPRHAKAKAAQVRKVRLAWQDTPKVTLRELGAVLGRSESWMSNAFWGRSGTPLTVGDLEKLTEVIRAAGGRI